MTRRTDLSFRPLTLQDTPAWSALIHALAAADGTGETYEPDDLAEELVQAGADASADTCGVWDGRTLVAYGQVHVSTARTAEGLARAHLGGGVHPRWRGRGIATALFERMEARALRTAGRRHPGAAVQLSASGGVDGADARAFLAGRGYAPARWFTDMARPLPGPPLGPALGPAGGRVEPYEDTMAEELRLAHNDAFSTHWGSTARSPEVWADLVGARSARTDLWRVVREPGGRILAYCSVSQWREGALYVDRVGTRQEARGRGLARAVLLGTVAAAAADGAWTTMELTVDAANPTRADALYRSVGFVPVRTQAAFTHTVPPGA
ncbi:GNAT family N-acetyltransferase [Kocuria turfanensis]|uniref:N-acetyltransferase n=1 Tax=Kocuria turfanensis TaxID=388357 RepID=A0A512IEY7_9MICC|nr:GNAT family N-acetyltransferase [Kocuria turfanensis]GEO96281.1 N-acetyltransferase [Kocuria turfanensis]